MKRVIITNNKKVKEAFEGKAEVKYINSTAIDIFEEARELAKSGGKMLVDPTRMPVKNYYRSIPFLVDGGAPSERSIDLIESCLGKLDGKKEGFAKEPVLAGLQQNKDMEPIKKVMG